MQPAVPIQIRERIFRRVLTVLAVCAALGLMGHLALLLWAQHEFTPVEALIGIHANMMMHGQGIYADPSHYPFTITAYGPIFYALSGGLHYLGVPSYQSGRGISFASLVACLWLCWKILGLLTGNRYAQIVGVLLAGCTANILYWGTVGQVDTLALALSLAAFALFLKFYSSERSSDVVLCGVFVVLAAFTKQTFVSAAAAIAICLVIKHWPRGLLWLAGVACAGATGVMALQWFVSPHFVQVAFRSNVNPFSLTKLESQLHYLVLTGCGVMAAVIAGTFRCKAAFSRLAPLYLYAGIATAVCLLTAPKIGSDLNYQIEMMILLCMCAAASLAEANFFLALFEARRDWLTLMQAPLLLHVLVNLILTGRALAERTLLEPLRREETAALRPYLTQPGRVLSEHYDSLLHFRGSIEGDPFLYPILVKAGIVDPNPMIEDLRGQHYSVLVLAENVFEPRPGPLPIDEVPRPAAQMKAIRENYRLTAHLDGLYGMYIYQPRGTPTARLVK